MYSEESLLPISALQHFVVCPRQCALIHLEQSWLESALTAEGRVLHERVDRGEQHSHSGCRLACGLPLRSLSLGLTGKADLVEFHREGKGRAARERPFPVEYKRGRPKRGDEDRLQLCAQALCLEEMLGSEIPAGALFYGQSRRRSDVAFDAALRQRTIETAAALHALIAEGRTPPPPPKAPCRNCSLESLCRPDLYRGRHPKPVSAKAWLSEALRQAQSAPPGDDTPYSQEDLP